MLIKDKSAYNDAIASFDIIKSSYVEIILFIISTYLYLNTIISLCNATNLLFAILKSYFINPYYIYEAIKYYLNKKKSH